MIEFIGNKDALIYKGIMQGANEKLRTAVNYNLLPSHNRSQYLYIDKNGDLLAYSAQGWHNAREVDTFFPVFLIQRLANSLSELEHQKLLNKQIERSYLDQIDEFQNKLYQSTQEVAVLKSQVKSLRRIIENQEEQLKKKVEAESDVIANQRNVVIANNIVNNTTELEQYSPWNTELPEIDFSFGDIDMEVEELETTFLDVPKTKPKANISREVSDPRPDQPTITPVTSEKRLSREITSPVPVVNEKEISRQVVSEKRNAAANDGFIRTRRKKRVEIAPANKPTKPELAGEETKILEAGFIGTAGSQPNKEIINLLRRCAVS